MGMIKVCIIVTLVYGVACNTAQCNTAECPTSGPRGADFPFQKADDTAVLLQAKKHVQRNQLSITNDDSDESHGLRIEEEEEEEEEEGEEGEEKEEEEEEEGEEREEAEEGEEE